MRKENPGTDHRICSFITCQGRIYTQEVWFKIKAVIIGKIKRGKFHMLTEIQK